MGSFLLKMSGKQILFVCPLIIRSSHKMKGEESAFFTLHLTLAVRLIYYGVLLVR